MAVYLGRRFQHPTHGLLRTEGVSFDSSGKASASFAFGQAFKLSYDPFKTNWGFALGIGVQFGVGQWAAGGAVVIKFDHQKTGVAVTGGALYTSAEQFFGFQRIPAKVSFPDRAGGFCRISSLPLQQQPSCSRCQCFFLSIAGRNMGQLNCCSFMTNMSAPPEYGWIGLPQDASPEPAT